jgi:predicted O-linked N-acetylglucosamine transferase (SPINDLY family)
VDHFRDIEGCGHLNAAQLIHADGVHILFDLAGYSTYCRPAIFAHRPAPIQVAYLGFPDTTGADYMDYLVADRQLIGPELEPYYTEAIAYLPNAFVSSPLEISQEPVMRGDAGLPEDAVVYCCFNAAYKITPGKFEVWMRILRSVRESVLWLSFGSEVVCANLRRESERLGVDPERLIFAQKLAMPDYLNRLALADLFLDTEHYSAGSTAICAAYAGVPILTTRGPTNASRMSASIVVSTGLTETICQSVVDYERLAISLGNNPARLCLLRETLRSQRDTAGLFDTKAFVGTLEQALETMWDRHTSAQGPANFDVLAT